ncbi:four helix bundle protein [Patescibacteria group bacterium]|nr:four helix bundle protein [Patescibacteria group bacterium]
MYCQLYEISLKSANETNYWLGLLRDAKIADANKINNLLNELNEISNMIAAGVIKLKRKILNF